jgi:hypothetical protein
MSITFSPDFDFSQMNLDPNELVWMGNFYCYENKPELKKFLRERFNIEKKDLNLAFFDFDFQPYEFWRSRLEGSSLKLKYERPFYKEYADGECKFILDGEFPNSSDKNVNLSTANAKNLLILLGIDFDYSGSIDPIVLSKKIESKLNDRLTEFTKPATDRKIKPTDFSTLIRNQDKFSEPAEEEEDGIRVIDFGLDQSQLETQLLRLQRLCDFCIEKNCDVSWG